MEVPRSSKYASLGKRVTCQRALMVVERDGKLHAEQGRQSLPSNRISPPLKQRWHNQRGTLSRDLLYVKY